MDKFAQWLSDKFQHPLSPLFFLVGVILILLGINENLAIPILNQLIPLDKFRWFSIICGLAFCAVSIALYYFPPKPIKPSIKIELHKPIPDDLWISSDRRNHQNIDSSFLTWDECTILFWIFVPRKGEGLRDAPHNRYIFAHQTGEGENSRHLNAFFFRYSSANTWDFIFSNPQGEMAPDQGRFRSENGLEEGWHHVKISWNNKKPLLTFLIDSGDRINIRYQSHLNYWPRERDASIYIGAWVNPYPDSYCNTKLAHFWICNKDLELTDSIVEEHLSLIGRE